MLNLYLNKFIAVYERSEIMIKCNLAVLLAERELKMSDVVKNTSLAKNTVRSLYYNSAKGIQFETLETLCDYLSCDIEDLFKKVTFELDIEEVRKISETDYEIDILFKKEKSDPVHDRITVSQSKQLMLNLEDSNTSETFYPSFKFHLSKQAYNFLKTLPQKRTQEFIEENVLKKFFNYIQLNLNEVDFFVFYEKHDGEFKQWFGQNNF